jgi:hypothetical protein
MYNDIYISSSHVRTRDRHARICLDCLFWYRCKLGKIDCVNTDENRVRRNTV